MSGSPSGQRDGEPDGGAPLAERVRSVHRSFPTGVTVVTTCVRGVPYGLVVNAFSSISLTPPLVLVCVAQTTSTYPRLFDSDHLAINILAHDQADVAMRFAGSGGDKFSGFDWRAGEYGAPLLVGASAALEVKVETRLPAYTHTVFIGRVLAANRHDRTPLVYLGGKFFDGGSVWAAPQPSETEQVHEQSLQ
jgi:flavin reductase (DIM6/NTAB) family NADH-FMN oxidoreductase RutF